MKKTFEGKINKERFTYINLPFDASKVFNKKGKIIVTGEINGNSYTKPLLSRGNGKYILTLNKQMLKEFDISVGDTVIVSMELEDNKENVDLDKHNDIKKYYQSAKQKNKTKETLNIYEAIFTRRSIRRFTGDEVKEQDLKTIIKAGCYAPSANNKQPWEFIVIKKEETLKKISEANSHARMIVEAGCGFIVCGDKNKQTQTGFLIEDCSASIQNMLLCAHGLGLGAVWCGLYPVTHLTKSIKKIFELPNNIVPVGLVVVGHTELDTDIVFRYNEEKIHMEKW